MTSQHIIDPCLFIHYAASCCVVLFLIIFRQQPLAIATSCCTGYLTNQKGKLSHLLQRSLFTIRKTSMRNRFEAIKIFDFSLIIIIITVRSSLRRFIIAGGWWGGGRIQWRFCADSENMISHSSSNYSRTESLSFMLEYFTKIVWRWNGQAEYVLTTRAREKNTTRTVERILKWFLWIFASWILHIIFTYFLVWSREYI